MASNMGTVSKEANRFDISTFYTHPDAKVDVILIHGLNGDPQKSWTSKTNGVCWPTDLLPQTLTEAGTQANVLSWGWNADVASKNPSSEFIHERARTLVKYLTSYRKRAHTLRNPIIWVVHSMGGILLKKALLHSAGTLAPNQEDDRAVFVSTRAIVFLGTPHTGSKVAKWGEILQGMSGHIPKLFFDSEPILIKTLRENSETLDSINDEFLQISQRFDMHLIHETHKTNLRGTKRLIVDSYSASPNWVGAHAYGIEADHSGMCKFDGTNAPGYRQVTEAIIGWIETSLPIIAIRWSVEDDNRVVQAQLELHERAAPRLAASGAAQGAVSTPVVVSRNETVAPTVQIEAPPSPLPMLPSSQSTRESTRTQDSGIQTSQEPLFIHPEAFRPNSYFVGRKEELKALHSVLQDPKRRAEGTSTALVRCQTGGGKTHLARQYVFKHRLEFPGGVFWLRASSADELEDEFCTIARTVAYPDLAVAYPDDVQDHTKVVDRVRKWFNSFDNWLIVLDAILFDPGMEKFVPDKTNTSMILTSTSPSVTGNHHFNNPKLLELPPMPTHHARELLLLEMEKNKPWAQADLEMAEELVLLLDKLPLIIHLTAQSLKQSSEPLSAFLKRYKSKPVIQRKIQPYEDVLHQLYARGASAARNVLFVLAFLKDHVPVEMLAMGLRALDKATPYKTREAGTHEKASLNNTLKVLVAFAVVERSDSYDLSPTSSQTSKKSLEMGNDTMDTLRLHKLHQQYIVQSLAGSKTHLFWLQRACEVFLRAYYEAHARIKDNPKIGLPDDYRRLRSHGKKLVEHLSQFEKKMRHGSELRTGLEDKVREIEKELRQLEESIESRIATQSGEIPQLSIFDRANSLSESDSGTTSSQNTSQQMWTTLDDSDQIFQLSPVAMDPPYPNEEGSPTPHVTPTQGPVNALMMPDEEDFQAIVPEVKHPLADIPCKSPTPPGNGRMTNPKDFLNRAGSNKARVSSGLIPSNENTHAEFSQGPGSPPASTGLHRLKDNLKENMPFGRRRKSSTGSNRRPSLQTIFPFGTRRKSSASSLSTSLQDLKSRLGRRKSSASSTSRPSMQAPDSVHTSPGMEQTATMPSFPVHPTRSARSSPGQGQAPFYPPDTPAKRQPRANTRRNPPPQPPSLHQWATTDAPYQPGRLGRIDSSNLGQNSMAQSFPATESMARQQDTDVLVNPAAWLQSQGAISVPMSRGSSHPSSHLSSHSRNRSTDSGHPGNTNGTRVAAEQSRGSFSPLSSPVSASPGLPALSSRLPNQSSSSRPASIVTEPSPRVNPRFEIMEPPSQTQLGPPAIPSRRGSQSNVYKRTWSRLRGRGGRGGRAHSQSHSVSPGRGSRASLSPHGSPDPAGGGEAMMRSGSGGILVGQGSGRQIIEFGELQMTTDAASTQWHADRRAPRGRQHSPQRGVVRSPPMSRSSSGNVGLGITPEDA